jgi:DNA-binding transcriptional regulator YhcF (GntR family)
MLSTADILCTIEDQRIHDVKELARKLDISLKQLKEILQNLSKHKLVDYDTKSGKVVLSDWLVDINKEIEEAKPPTGAIILPKNEEVKIQDMAIGNFTKKDLELRIRLKTKLKEISICDLS